MIRDSLSIKSTIRGVIYCDILSVILAAKLLLNFSIGKNLVSESGGGPLLERGC